MFGVLSHIDIVKLGQLLKGSVRADVLISLLMLALAVIVNSHRWAAVSKQLGQPLRMRSSLLGYFESLFFNQVLPSSIGGDAVRVLRAVDVGISYRDAIVGVLIDRMLGIWIVAICILTVYALHVSEIANSPVFLVLFLVSAAVVVGAVFLIVGKPLLGLSWPSWASPLLFLIKSFQATIISRAWPVLFLDLCLTTAFSVISFWMCVRALGINIDWLSAMVVLQGITLASIIPATIGGWGLREGAAVLLFAPIGVDVSKATAVSILFGLVLTALGLLGALVWLVAGYRRKFQSPLQRRAAA